MTNTNGTPAPAPIGGRVVDLNAARAARAEIDREAVMVAIGEETFTLPVEMSYDVLRLAARGDMDGAILALLGGDQDAANRLYSQKLTMDDLEALIDGASEMYGVGAGKKKASSGRSKRAST